MRRLPAAFALAVLGGLVARVGVAGDLLFKNSFESTWIAGYHVGYQSGTLPTSDINFNDITHLMIGAIVPNTDGSLDTTFFIDATNGPIWAHGAVDAAHAHGRKAILMIGGAGAITGWQGAASDTHRNAFVTNLLSAVDTYAADGLDLDWEPIDATNDAASLTALVQALRTARPNLILTMPVGAYNQNFAPGPGSDDANLFAALYPLLDQINVMSYGNAYDYSGWYSWFSSALAGEQGNYPIDISSSIADYESFGVPAAKLGVGIGAYGLCFKHVTAPRQATNSGDLVNGDDNTMTYAHIASAYVPSMTYAYDSIAHAPWLSHATQVGPEGCTYITYENATSIIDKGAWVLANGLGGTIIWTIGEGHLGPGDDPLLDAARIGFP